MRSVTPTELECLFPACKRTLGPTLWGKAIASLRGQKPEAFPETLTFTALAKLTPPFIQDLAALELAMYRVKQTPAHAATLQAITVNPALELLSLSWQGLPKLISENAAPVDGKELVLIWRSPAGGSVLCEPASHADLLALKVIIEELSAEDVAKSCDTSTGTIDFIIRQAIHKGILVSPPSRIRRDQAVFDPSGACGDELLTAPLFTLQWHITQACDLHCRHCYDRSNRRAVELTEGLRILDDLRDFCSSRFVQGQVSFSGGNPFLHPQFTELYRAAADRGLFTVILGNPVQRQQVEEIITIRKPGYFQVSLEGLEEHNDHIRGSGHFQRTIAFLKLLRELEITSLVMLTLTRQNMAQVLPLAEILRDLTDGFTFNRLALVGEGANLQVPGRDEYAAFLHDYRAALPLNPVLALKDNLLNTVFHRSRQPLFHGCTGYGCGAAFNFVSLLPDGEVHACRKFPSPIGTTALQSLSEIYESSQAHRYRQGCTSCSGCPVRPVCGGCLAVAHSHGLDIFSERDPFCFMEFPK